MILSAKALKKQRGSILVICMVLAALGTIGVAAWISLIDARGHQVQVSYERMKRRAALQSSKALAYDVLYSNHLHTGSGAGSNTTYTVPGSSTASSPTDPLEYTNENVASVTVQAYANAPLESSSATRTTKNGVTPLRSFTTDVAIQVSDNASTQTMNVQMRSYNPVLAGDLLTMYPTYDADAFATSNTLIEGNMIVNGRAVFWDAATKDFKGGLVAEQYVIQNDTAVATTGSHNFPTPGGGTTMPLNYPIPKQTTGYQPIPATGSHSAPTPAYKGELDIVKSVDNSHNANITRWSSTGTVTSISGFSPSVISPGDATSPDTPDDATLEAEIASKTPDELMATLPGYYPLSSRILRAVADKTGPDFSADQLYAVYSNHFPIPHDALSYLLSTHNNKISSRVEELLANNGTAAYSDGNGKVEIFLDRAALTHVEAVRAHEIVLRGQENAADASAAAAMAPVGIAINNTGGDSIHALEFRGQNRRRIILSINTEQWTPSPTFGYLAELTFTGPDPFPEWHMIMELQNTGAYIETSPVNTANIVGGILGTRPIDISGTLSLRQQFNIDGYEELLSRTAWVETYITP